MIQFRMLRPKMTSDHLGLIPDFFDPSDPRSAREQAEERYAHGGGWRPMPGWKCVGQSIQYPGDEEMHPLAVSNLRDEIICVYESAFVAIFQPNGSFEVSRMD